MSLLTVLLILAVFGIAFLLVLAVVIRIEVSRERRARSAVPGNDASVEWGLSTAGRERVDLASTLDVVKRRRIRQRDELEARESAERRRDDLLAQLRAREAAARGSAATDTPAVEIEPEPVELPQEEAPDGRQDPEAAPQEEAAEEAEGVGGRAEA
jgi:hypothetical protein